MDNKMLKTYRMLPWIAENRDKLTMSIISRNEKAISFLEQNQDIIDWVALSANPAAIHIIEQNLHRVDWSELSSNKNAIHILEKNPDKIDWNHLCRNSSDDAYALLAPNADKITDWSMLCKTENRWINKLLANNMDKFIAHSPQNLEHLCRNLYAMPIIGNHVKKLDRKCWSVLSRNKNAIKILGNNPRKIDYSVLQYNENPDAYLLFEKYERFIIFTGFDIAGCDIMVPYLRKNPDLIDHYILSNRNPDALDLILKYIEERKQMGNMFKYREGCVLSQNPLTIDMMYEKYREHIYWSGMSLRDEAIHILRDNLDKVYWEHMCYNIAAMDILKDNQDKIDWKIISSNEGIYAEIVE